MDCFGGGGKGWSGADGGGVFQEACGQKTGDRLMEFLRNAPNVLPEPEDKHRRQGMSGDVTGQGDVRLIEGP
jgi:hypothetical protein